MGNRWEMESKLCLEGLLLVAAPHWHDELFGRSVCLVVHHSSQRAVGVFLNRSLGSGTPSLWQHLAGEQPGVKQGIVHFGGPHSGFLISLLDAVGFAATALFYAITGSVAEESWSLFLKILLAVAGWSMLTTLMFMLGEARIEEDRTTV